MIEHHPSPAKTASNFDENTTDKRTPRAIRFSESEWKRIRTAASARGISIGGFVRDAALHRVAEHSGMGSAPFSAGIEELIKQTFRYTFVLASIKRNELVGEGRQHSVDDAVSQALAAQDELLISPRSNLPSR